MRRTIALLCFLSVIASFAQTPNPKASGSKAVSHTPGATPEATPRQLPVRQVILYKNGIGYFEHRGQITGNQHVAIDFTSSQLNDVLQSLTILDENGGRIGGVNYNSTTPLAEQLKSLSLAMSDDPTSTELFQALRGQRVEVLGAPGGPVTGHLMSIETLTQKSADANANTVTEKNFLTVVTTAGAVRVLELTPALSVRPTDPALQSQLDRYLELLSSSRSTGLRHLTLDALGAPELGQRQLRVSYISEVPVWKSTYRLVFPRDSTDQAGGPAILQGWAVVDNTIGSDWDNVQLSLVAGAPQSFIQPLSQPLYLRRPEVPISTTAMTTPQTHEAADMNQAQQSNSANSVMVDAQQVNDLALNGRNFSPLIKVAPGAAAKPGSTHGQSYRVAGMEGTGSGTGSGNGFGLGSGGSAGGGVYRTGAGVNRPSDALQEGDVATNTFDDFFEYSLAQPVTIHKNESAMVPILQEKLPAERVTLWSASEPTPFRAIWLQNSSKLTFDRGSFSIFESGVFAGQGLLDPIHPGEKRLLSYAADQAIRVRETGTRSDRTLRSVSIDTQNGVHGVIRRVYAAQTKRTWLVNNSADQSRVVLLEIPRQPNRKLSPETKAAESTPDLYRFKVPVEAHKAANLQVDDEGTDLLSWTLNPDGSWGNTGDGDQAKDLEALMTEVPAIADALKPVLELQRKLYELSTQLKELDEKSKTLTADEARARENLTALKGNDAGKRFVDELNRAEDELETTRKQTASVSAEKKATIQSLKKTLESLDIHWSAPAKPS